MAASYHVKAAPTGPNHAMSQVAQDYRKRRREGMRQLPQAMEDALKPVKKIPIPPWEGLDWVPTRSHTTVENQDTSWNPASVLLQQKPDLPCLQREITVMAASEDSKSKIHKARFDTDGGEVGIDNRCSKCMSPYKKDFIGELQKIIVRVTEFGGTHKRVMYIGTLQWKIEDDQGRIHNVIIPGSYYSPDCQMRLISPQHWAQEAKNRGNEESRDPEGVKCTGLHNRMILEWGNGKFTKTVPVDAHNVYTFELAHGYEGFTAFCSEIEYDTYDQDIHPSVLSEDHTEICQPATVGAVPVTDVSPEAHIVSDDESSVSDEQTGNTQDDPTTDEPNEQGDHNTLTQPPTSEVTIDHPRQDDSAELLRYHYKFGHIPFKRLQEMAKQGTIPKRMTKCPVPVCAACLYGKAHKRPTSSKKKKKVREGAIINAPGDCVSVDIMVSATPGLIAQMSGFLTRERYKYVCVFVDHFSDFSYVHLLRTQTAEEVLQAKEAFEAFAETHGVKIKHYHADNGIFASKGWREHCRVGGQGLTFAGVNAHHQNGVAERKIRSLQELARSDLIHAHHRWPSAVTANLWPYATRAACDSLNCTPCAKLDHKTTPLQVFSQTAVDINPRRWQPMFCPVYALKAPLQAGKPMNKWTSRSRVGMYLGRSPMHSRNVALVLNLETGRVSPQFHVMFDPGFETLRPDRNNLIPVSKWQQATGFAKGGSSRRDSEPPALQQVFVAPGDTTTPEQLAAAPPAAPPDPPDPATIAPPPPAQPPPPPPPPAASAPSEGEQATATTRRSQRGAARGQPMSDRDAWHATREAAQGSDTGTASATQPVEASAAAPPAAAPTAVRRSNRANRGRRTEPTYQQEFSQLSQIEGEIMCCQAMFPELVSQAASVLHPEIVSQAASADPDTMYFHQAMKEPDSDKFLGAAHKEFDSMLKKGIVEIVPKSRVPEGVKVFPAVWSMKRKRRVVSKEIYKYKARMNLDGSKQREGRDYEETYAPVASWESIRILLTLVLKNKWKTRQLDYVLAFPQAPVEKECYMKIPKGIVIDEPGDWVLLVKKNIYGQKQAGRVWNKYLVDKLKKIGFRQSEHDECIFYRGKMIYLLYTDDSILAGPDDKELDQAVKDLQAIGLDITDEGKLEDFLGVNIEEVDEYTYHLSQPQLIDQILKDMRLDQDNVTVRETPALVGRPLGACPDSPEFDQHFHYRSVLGKLNYLEKSTRPDIAYAVHQCARYSSDPRKEHGEALKHIGRYLKGTRGKGITLNIKDEEFQVWADADFSGNWIKEEAEHDANTARSRSGYLITYLGCPIMWKSQLQTQIALSSCESEYISLSQATRKVIPVMELVQEMKTLGYDVGNSTRPTIRCKLFEDNSGALTLAKAPAMRPRTKHINVKYHHFRSHVEDGTIDIRPVGTRDQVADFLTKQSEIELFLLHRKAVMGW